MYGGSWDWLQPSFEYGGRAGPVDWFVTGDFLHNNRGIENPTSSYNAIHDTTNQFHGLAYVSGIIDPNTRVSLILGGFAGGFQIPNNPGQPTLGLKVNGVSDFNSATLNETQHERTQFAILSLQKHIDDVDLQISAFTRSSTCLSRPTRSAICCSTASRSRQPHDSRPACRATEAGGSTSSTRCAPASWRKARATSEHVSQVLPVDGRARRPPTCRLASSRTAARPAASTASTSRMNGGSCRR